MPQKIIQIVTFNYTIFSAGTNSANNIDNIKFYKNAGGDDANKIEYSSYTGSYQYLIYTNAKYRDPEGWYHVVWNYDGTTAKLYVNGEQITSFDTNTQNGGSSGHFNNNVSHVIGHSPDQQYNMEFDGHMSQFYWIDGQRLGPGFFGFTDPLTGTWRPKKLRQGDSTVNDGTTWSSIVTATGSGAVSGINGSYPVTGAFDTNSGTYLSTSAANISSNPAILTVTFPAGKEPSFSSDVVVYVGGSTSDTIKISFNGSPFETVTRSSTGFVPHIFATGTGKIKEIKVSRQKSNTNAGGAEIQSIFVDGIQLIDNTTTNVDFGTNGFYLPMDGNSPIGQDKSGKGNDWTPVNFGGSTGVDQATGALPILEGAGGAVANVGVRTDANAANLVLALPLVGNKEDVVASINSAQTNVTVTITVVFLFKQHNPIFMVEVPSLRTVVVII